MTKSPGEIFFWLIWGQVGAIFDYFFFLLLFGGALYSVLGARARKKETQNWPFLELYTFWVGIYGFDIFTSKDV